MVPQHTLQPIGNAFAVPPFSLSSHSHSAPLPFARREAKDPRVLEGLDTSAISYLPPDFDSWKQGGGTMGRQPRNIQSERWGANVRELKAPPNDL